MYSITLYGAALCMVLCMVLCMALCALDILTGDYSRRPGLRAAPVAPVDVPGLDRRQVARRLAPTCLPQPLLLD